MRDKETVALRRSAEGKCIREVFLIFKRLLHRRGGTNPRAELKVGGVFIFRRAVEELIARNYFGTMRRRAHEHGMVIYAEAQGAPLNPISSNPYLDVPMNEFWVARHGATLGRRASIVSFSTAGSTGSLATNRFRPTSLIKRPARTSSRMPKFCNCPRGFLIGRKSPSGSGSVSRPGNTTPIDRPSFRPA